jgi:two-component system, cell cycle sensor histidine kinase and response regulator CckA
MKPTFLSTTSENARMAQLFGHVRDAVIMLDTFGVVVFWSAGAATILGRAAPEALNQCYPDLIPKPCRRAQVPLIHRALDGETGSAEWQTVDGTGNPMWLEGDFRPVADDTGKRIGCAILLHDVTRWRAAEAACKASETALRESEARYRLLTDNTTDMIGRLTPDGDFRYASPGALGLFGTDPETFLDTPFGEWLHPEDEPRLRDAIARLAGGGASHTLAHRSRHADGHYVWCESTVRAVRDATGEVVELVTVTRNIEERRKFEARVQNVQKMEAIGRLAGGVAHDFNNLLTVINGFSEMILRGIGTQDPARTAAQVREIRQAGERAAGLTRQLLAFGRQQIQAKARLSLNTVVTDTRKLLDRLIGEDVEFETALAPDLGPVLADAGQLGQVLVNLCLNARDAMPDGGTLTVTTANVRIDKSDEDVRAGHYVLLAVTDTGMGMDEAIRARIFEPFFTTKEQGKGTGLGLAMVYGIVQQSDGHVTVESEIGRGTTFRIYLPRCDVAEEAAAKVYRNPLLVGRETVLLVEDDDGVRKVTAAMLKALGYKVLEAPGGMEALRMCREFHGPIHLLLTDVVMPMMNGREVADRVRGILPGIKTLFVSGYTDDAILRHGVLDEGVAFLNKPLAHEPLARKLREVLGTSAAL